MEIGGQLSEVISTLLLAGNGLFLFLPHPGLAGPTASG